MNKSLALISLCLSILIVPVEANVYSGTCGTNLNWILSTTTGRLSITGYGDMDNMWRGSSAGAPWLAYVDSITSISMPEGLTHIGDNAFHNCRRVTSITIPNTVTSIGHAAFSNCIGLSTMVIPNSVKTISSWVFTGCSGMQSIYMGTGLTEVLDSFSGCTSLREMHISNLAKWCNIKFSMSSDYSSNPLSYAHNLYLNGELVTDLVIPEGVDSIKMFTFTNCTSITSVTIPSSVNFIGWGAFYGCDSLKTVHIDNLANWCMIQFDNTTLMPGQFANPLTFAKNLYLRGSLLTDLSIPSSVSSIRDYAFYNAKCLKSVTLPNTVANIRDNAFYGCDSLKTVYNYSETPQSIQANVFSTATKYTGILYVPASSLEDYQMANVWQDFTYIQPIVETSDEQTVTVRYMAHDGSEIDNDSILLNLPNVPVINGFTFVGWKVLEGFISNEIIIQAVYQSDEPTDATMVINSANPSQKLIRNGNVYILTGDKTYTITGMKVE